MDLDLLDDANERCGGKFANVLEGNLTDQKSISAPLNALRLHAQIRSLENSSVGDLPPNNTGKDNREHCDDCRRHCGGDGGPISGA